MVPRHKTTIVFVPGIKGSACKDVWPPNDAALRSLLVNGTLGPDFFERAASQRNFAQVDSSTSAGIICGINLFGGVFKIAADYGVFIDRLDKLAHKYSCDLLLFPYDWRNDALDTGDALMSFLRHHKYSSPSEIVFTCEKTFFGEIVLGKSVADCREENNERGTSFKKHEGRRYVIASHSFGYEVVKQCLALGKDDLGSVTIVAHIAIAPPVAGGMTNITSWLDGHKTSALFSRQEMNYLLANFDSIKGLLRRHSGKKTTARANKGTRFSTAYRRGGKDVLFVTDRWDPVQSMRRVYVYATPTVNEYSFFTPQTSRKQTIKCIGDGTVDYICSAPLSDSLRASILRRLVGKSKDENNDREARPQQRSRLSFYFALLSKAIQPSRVNHHKLVLINSLDLIENVVSSCLLPTP